MTSRAFGLLSSMLILLSACTNTNTNTRPAQEAKAPSQEAKEENVCARFDNKTCVVMGKALLAKKEDANPQLATQMFAGACDRGEQEGCFQLAVSYHEGRGVKVNMPKALSVFQQACDMAGGTACVNASI